MLFILFNTCGQNFIASEFVARHSIKGVSVWEKGQPLRSGKKHEDSGFSINLGELDTNADVVSFIESFIKENEKWLCALVQQPVNSLLNIGMTVGDNISYVPCLELDVGILDLLVQNKIGLHILGYPTSQE